MSHPIRFQALTILSGRVASPNEMARELGHSVGVLAYHVRVLRDLGAIELVDTRPRRGATEHFYRATVRPWFSEEDLEGMPPHARRGVFAPTVRRVVDDAVGALTVGGFDGPDAHVSWTALDLDEQGRREATELLVETVARLGELAEAAGERSTDCRRSAVALLHFQPAAEPDPGASEIVHVEGAASVDGRPVA